MAKFRLKENHSTRKKIEALIKCADDLGLSLVIEGNVFGIEDEERPGEKFWLSDIENELGGFETYGPHEFPPTMEFHILTEKD